MKCGFNMTMKNQNNPCSGFIRVPPDQRSVSECSQIGRLWRLSFGIKKAFFSWISWNQVQQSQQLCTVKHSRSSNVPFKTAGVGCCLPESSFFTTTRPHTAAPLLKGFKNTAGNYSTTLPTDLTSHLVTITCSCTCKIGLVDI